MRRRIITSLIAACVYTGIYALLQSSREETLTTWELVAGGAAFFIAFLLSQTFIARKKQKQLHEKNKEDISS